MLTISFFKKFVPKTIIFLLACAYTHAQPITGVWKGKMGNLRVELKLVRKGDSLIGTSYYFNSKTTYRRYSVKGYFDDRNKEVIWWDDVLLEDYASHSLIGTGPGAMLAIADFNCPGEGIMKLDGNVSGKEDKRKDKKELHLVKRNTVPVFPDEWDFLIENYAYGLIHPELVDSIEYYAFHPEPSRDQTAARISEEPGNVIAKNSSKSGTPRQITTISKIPGSAYPVVISKKRNTEIEKQNTRSQGLQINPPSFLPPSEQTNEERFISRKKILQNVIPIKGDSIELRFYDNAEIDGDSIAVFLNGRLLQEHILLAEQAYIMKIAVSDLQPDNELVMVAENLGTIPPNTSLMVAIVEDKRYEAHLQSSEGSSALVRLVKP